MPYRRRYNRTKRRRYASKKRMGFKRRGSYRRVGFARRVLSVIKPELKSVLVYGADRQLSSDAPYFGNMTGNAVIAAGTSATTRVGDRIDIRNIHFNYTLMANPNATLPATTSVAVVQWLMDDSVDSLSDLADVYRDDADPRSANDPGQGGKFRVLWRKIFIVSDDTSNPKHCYHGSVYVRPRGLTTYDLTIDKRNHVFVIGWSDKTNASNNDPYFSLSGLVRFYDV